jgi:ubiquinol-cytochrome c reductase iron-sulfur subunit
MHLELLWVRRYNEVNHARFEPGHEGRPFAYFVQTGGRFLYASTIRLMVLKALVSLSVSVMQLMLANFCLPQP